MRCLEDVAADRKTAAFAALASGVYAQIQKCRPGPKTRNGGSWQGHRKVIPAKFVDVSVLRDSKRSSSASEAGVSHV